MEYAAISYTFDVPAGITSLSISVLSATQEPSNGNNDGTALFFDGVLISSDSATGSAFSQTGASAGLSCSSSACNPTSGIFILNELLDYIYIHLHVIFTHFFGNAFDNLVDHRVNYHYNYDFNIAVVDDFINYNFADAIFDHPLLSFHS
ncbi:hypothetical protein EsH8_X_000426 [Colletotrichum jinshuiense]